MSRDAPPSLHHSITPLLHMRRTNYIVFIFAGVMCHVSTPTPSPHHSITPSPHMRRTNYIVFIFAGVMCHVSTPTPSLHHSITPYETRQLHHVHFCRCNVSRLYTHSITPLLHHSITPNTSRLYKPFSASQILSFSVSQILRFYKPFQRTAPPKALQLSTKKRAKLQKILIQMLIFFKKTSV